MEEFAAEYFPLHFWQESFRPFLSCVTDCAALYEQNAIALKKIHVYLVLLQG